MNGMPVQQQGGQIMGLISGTGEPEQMEVQPAEEPSGKKWPKWFKWVVIILSVIIVAGLVVYFILG